MQNPRRTTLAIALTGALAAGALGCGTEKHINALRPPAPILLGASITPERISISPKVVGAGPITLVFTNLTGASQQVTFESAAAPGLDEPPGHPSADGADQPERHRPAQGDRSAGAVPGPRARRRRRPRDPRDRARAPVVAERPDAALGHGPLAGRVVPQARPDALSRPGTTPVAPGALPRTLTV